METLKKNSICLNNGHINICIVSKNNAKLDKIKTNIMTIISKRLKITYNIKCFNNFTDAAENNYYNIYIINSTAHEFSALLNEIDIFSLNSSAFFILISTDKSLIETISLYEGLFFIREENLEDELGAYLKKIIRLLFKDKLVFNLSINLLKNTRNLPTNIRNDAFLHIPINDIEYVVKEANYLRIHYYFKNGLKDIYFRSTLKECYEQFKYLPQFLLINRGYLINGYNCQKIDTIENIIHTKSGDTITFNKNDLKNLLIESIRIKLLGDEE